jgi:hypothetical protein
VFVGAKAGMFAVKLGGEWLREGQLDVSHSASDR